MGMVGATVSDQSRLALEEAAADALGREAGRAYGALVEEMERGGWVRRNYVYLNGLDTKSARLVAMLRDEPRRPVRELALALYGDGTREHVVKAMNLTRALLAQLVRYRRVRRVKAGSYEALPDDPALVLPVADPTTATR